LRRADGQMLGGLPGLERKQVPHRPKVHVELQRGGRLRGCRRRCPATRCGGRRSGRRRRRGRCRRGCGGRRAGGRARRCGDRGSAGSVGLGRPDGGWRVLVLDSGNRNANLAGVVVACRRRRGRNTDEAAPAPLRQGKTRRSKRTAQRTCSRAPGSKPTAAVYGQLCIRTPFDRRNVKFRYVSASVMGEPSVRQKRHMALVFTWCS
jgi:hypothetical protein